MKIFKKLITQCDDTCPYKGGISDFESPTSTSGKHIFLLEYIVVNQIVPFKDENDLNVAIKCTWCGTDHLTFSLMRDKHNPDKVMLHCPKCKVGFGMYDKNLSEEELVAAVLKDYPDGETGPYGSAAW